MRTLNVFYDTRHLEPEKSGLKDYLNILSNINLKGLFYELRIYKGLTKDLTDLANGELSVEELLSRFKTNLPRVISSPCINIVLEFSKNNEVQILPFGLNGSGGSDETEYLTSLKNILEQGLEDGNYSLIIGGLHEGFFNKEIKPVLEKHFDKVVQSVAIDKWWVKA